MTRAELIMEKVQVMPPPQQEAVLAFVESLAGCSERIEAIAAAQGTAPIHRFEDILGGWPEDELNDAFEQAAADRRNALLVPEFEEP